MVRKLLLAYVLDEMAANDAIETGEKAAVVVKYTPKTGWNTIALPFAPTNDILTQIFGEEWQAYEFNGYADGALSFKTATLMVVQHSKQHTLLLLLLVCRENMV